MLSIQYFDITRLSSAKILPSIDVFKLMEPLRMHYFDFDNDKVHIRNNEQYENALKYCDSNGIYLLKLHVREGHEIPSSDDELDPVAEEEVHANKIPDKNADKSSARNGQVFSQNQENDRMDDSGDAFKTAKDLLDTESGEMYYDALSEKSPELNQCDVLKPASVRILNRVAKDVKPKQGRITGWFKDIGSYIGVREGQKDYYDLAVIEDSNPELGNEDIILAVPGCVVKKTWRVTNKQGKPNLNPHKRVNIFFCR